jgi:lantibiotic modifying enzyme
VGTEEVRATVNAIAEALEDEGSTPSQRASRQGALAGELLFFAHLHAAFPAEAHLRRVISGVEECVSIIGNAPLRPALYGGLAGYVWLFAHLERMGFDFALDLSDFDEMFGSAVTDPDNDHFDLIYGLVGQGVYLLERLPAASARASLDALLKRLEELSESTPSGPCWRSMPKNMPSPKKEMYPEGHFDLGVAHGIPGVLAFLALVALNGIRTPLVMRLLRDSARWVVAERRVGALEIAYSYQRDPTGSQVGPGARAAWCYGDPGVAVALLLAGQALGDQRILTVARDVACRAAARAGEQTGVVDASLCHGSAGLTRIFRTLARRLGEPSLDRAADSWRDWTIKFRVPGEGSGGYRFCAASDAGPSWTADRSYLQGSSGIGLSMLSEFAGVDDSWSRLLLLS